MIFSSLKWICSYYSLSPSRRTSTSVFRVLKTTSNLGLYQTSARVASFNSYRIVVSYRPPSFVGCNRTLFFIMSLIHSVTRRKARHKSRSSIFFVSFHFAQRGSDNFNHHVSPFLFYCFLYSTLPYRQHIVFALCMRDRISQRFFQLRFFQSDTNKMKSRNLKVTP